MSDQSPIDHSGCVTHPDFSYSHLAHTHEGQTGFWLFPSEAPEPPPSPKTLKAATDGQLAFLGYHLGQAQGYLELGCTNSTKLAELVGGMGASVEPALVASLKAILLRIIDYAHTIQDQIEGKA